MELLKRKTEVKTRSPTGVKPMTIFTRPVSLKSFQNPQFQYVLISFKFVSPCLLLCLPSYLHLLLLFSKVIFMFHSIWKSSNFLNFDKLRKNAHLTKSKC